MSSIERFATWIREAEVGDDIMYMQADTAMRQPEVAEFFRRQAELGNVFLYQKKIRFGVYNFYARRLSKLAGSKLKPWGWK